MNDYPRHAVERAALRVEYLERILAEARTAGARSGLSMKCRGQSLLSPSPPRHTGDADGCRNDGSTCLCRCHDLGEAG